MAIITNWYTVDNKPGANLNQPQTISTTTNPDYPAANFALGDRCQGNNGSEWVFVQASATVTANNLVAISLRSSLRSFILMVLLSFRHLPLRLVIIFGRCLRLMAVLQLMQLQALLQARLCLLLVQPV